MIKNNTFKSILCLLTTNANCKPSLLPPLQATIILDYPQLSEMQLTDLKQKYQSLHLNCYFSAEKSNNKCALTSLH